MLAPMAEHRLRILHITDLHMRDEKSEPGAWRRGRVLGAEWEKNLAAIVQDGPLDLICFTGDLVQAGKPNEYAALTTFVDDLLARTGVARERLFVVPGNHDIDRSLAKTAWKQLRALGETEAEALSRWMAGERAPPRLRKNYCDEILQRQGAYRAWVRDGLRRPELLPTPGQHPRLGYRVSLRLPGRPFDVQVIGLDSAWLAGDDGDARKLRLTEDQIGYLARDLPGFRLALVHHPLGELADGEACRDLLASRVDLLLRGHLHETRLALWSEPDSELREVATGCLYQSDTYANGCTVLELRLDDHGRPRLPYRFWFRGWAKRGFWTDEDKLYRDSRGGRLSWPAGDDDSTPLPMRRADHFVGRTNELEQLVDALLPAAGPPLPVAVVALQGMPGVGKSYLVDRFAHLHRGRFPGGYHVLPLEPNDAPSLDILGSRLATLVGQRTWGAPGAWDQLIARLQAPATLIHIENVDSDGPIAAVVDLADRLAGCALVVSGRSRRFGRSLPFHSIEVQPLDEPTALDQLAAELGPALDAAAVAARRRLALALGYLPLALHLAAGYIADGHSVEGFLELLSAKGLALEPANLDDPLYRLDRARAVLSTTFELSIDLLQRRLGPDGTVAMVGFAVLGHAPGTGVRGSLGAAMAGLDENKFEVMMVEATRLSLASGTADVGWSIHPLLAELLRGRVLDRTWMARMSAWFIERLPPRPPGEEDTQGRCWLEIHCEVAALELWLQQVPNAEMVTVERVGSLFATVSGPFRMWMNFCMRLLDHADGPSERSGALWTLTQVAHRAGDISRAADAAGKKLSLDRERGDERGAALAVSALADILEARGELDEALRILREQQLPAYLRLGDICEWAATYGKVAGILEARGELDEALRICRDVQLPVYERLGDVRSRAVTLAKVADILEARGELDEAMRICQEELLPTFERLGDVRSRAITLGKVADILVVRGELDEAFRLYREELPVYERLGDVQMRAVMLGKVADILATQGKLDEALRLRREEQLPVYERLGDVRSRAMALGKVADILQAQGALDEALCIRREQLPVYERLGDIRSRALALGRVADILAAQGQLDEALRIYQEELPVLERLGDTRSLIVGRSNQAVALLYRDENGDREEAARLLRLALAAATVMQIPEVANIRAIQFKYHL